MNPTQLYSPIIKGKLNDLKAVDRLSEGTRSKIKPLIEVMPLPEKNTGLENHLKKFVNYIVKYAQVEEIFVDFYRISPQKTSNGIDATLAGFHLLKTHGVDVTPTYGFDRDEDLERDNDRWNSLRTVVKDFGNGFCFRIDIDDLDDQADATMSQIIERSSQLGLKPKDVDLLIDLRDLSDRDMDELKELVLDFLQLIPPSLAYRSIILAGSSALKTVTKIIPDGVGDIIRKELRLWINIQRDLPESLSLVYGDYGIIHPDFSGGVPSKYINAKIRYTNQGRITYYRGHGLLHPINDYAQYSELANKVRNSPCYMGRNFSAGDQYVDDVADADLNESHGSPATWVLADMNHHLEYTTMQMVDLVNKVRIEETVPELEAMFAE